ncbi:hypothetical protein LTS15_002896 [Exophiala xenobiotica]|nr:hypothetical protein LTS15_002896 [Exophiala xenobiotica]
MLTVGPEGVMISRMRVFQGSVINVSWELAYLTAVRISIPDDWIRDTRCFYPFSLDFVEPRRTRSDGAVALSTTIPKQNELVRSLFSDVTKQQQMKLEDELSSSKVFEVYAHGTGAPHY